jgi:hypothetical protein
MKKNIAAYILLCMNLISFYDTHTGGGIIHLGYCRLAHKNIIVFGEQHPIENVSGFGAATVQEQAQAAQVKLDTITITTQNLAKRQYAPFAGFFNYLQKETIPALMLLECRPSEVHTLVQKYTANPALLDSFDQYLFYFSLAYAHLKPLNFFPAFRVDNFDNRIKLDDDIYKLFFSLELFFYRSADGFLEKMETYENGMVQIENPESTTYKKYQELYNQTEAALDTASYNCIQAIQQTILHSLAPIFYNNQWIHYVKNIIFSALQTAKNYYAQQRLYGIEYNNGEYLNSFIAQSTQLIGQVQQSLNVLKNLSTHNIPKEDAFEYLETIRHFSLFTQLFDTIIDASLLDRILTAPENLILVYGGKTHTRKLLKHLASLGHYTKEMYHTDDLVNGKKIVEFLKSCVIHQ